MQTTLQPSTAAWQASPHRSAPATLIDGCGRRIDHVRVSVTPECDLRCIYCKPNGDDDLAVNQAALSDVRRVEFIRFLHRRYALSKLRITGGEPLLHPTIVSFVATLRQTMPNLALAMTTHGHRLSSMAQPLREAGLDRLNISLDSLDPVLYRRVTGGSLQIVLDGIEAARAAGFPAPKINTVVLRGVNDTEVVSLTEWALGKGLEIRFLESMPIGPAVQTNRKAFVSARDIKRRLSEAFSLHPLERPFGETAACYRVEGGGLSGVVGMIAPMSEPFCGQCRRIRLTADGKVFPCLLDSRFVDLSPAWNDESLDEQIAEALIESAVAGKKPAGPQLQETPMVTIGG